MDKKIITLTHRRLLNLLIKREVNQSSCSSYSLIHTITNIPLLKHGRVTGKKCPYKSISKSFTSYCSLNINYSSAVQNKMVRVGLKKKSASKFKSGKMKWGYFIELPNGQRSKLVIQHKDGKYLRLNFPNNTFEIDYLNGNKEIDLSKIEEFIPVQKEQFYKVRNFKLSSIREIRIDDVIYRIAK